MVKKEVRVRNLLILKRKKGQIWVETIIYTLIAFALIGLVLAFVNPEIEKIQDRGFIERSIDTLEEIDFIIDTIGVPGNQREIGLGISKGTFNVDGKNDRLFFEIESRHTYSEPGENITSGNVIINTEELGRLSEVTLTVNYGNRYDITFDGQNDLGEITESPTPYRILIKNEGENSENQTIINMEILD